MIRAPLQLFSPHAHLDRHTHSHTESHTIHTRPGTLLVVLGRCQSLAVLVDCDCGSVCCHGGCSHVSRHFCVGRSRLGNTSSVHPFKLYFIFANQGVCSSWPSSSPKDVNAPARQPLASKHLSADRFRKRSLLDGSAWHPRKHSSTSSS